MTSVEVKKVLDALLTYEVKWKDFESGKFFYKKPVDIYLAISELNRIIIESDYADLETWYDILQLPEYPTKFRYAGWSYPVMVCHGYMWLYFLYGMETDKDGLPYFTLTPEIYPADENLVMLGGRRKEITWTKQ